MISTAIVERDNRGPSRQSVVAMGALLDGWLQVWKSRVVVVLLAAPLRVNVFAFHD